MNKLRERLQIGRNGNAVLFCGAGLTADCLNFDDDSTLGVTHHLLKILNEDLKSSGKPNGFKDIKNAAKRFRSDLGNHRLMNLLKSRFQLSKVSTSIVDIARYPWGSIYTTNYDNGLELALHSLYKKYIPLNNLDDPNASAIGTPIIHLHGFAEAWTNATFEQSCILDTDSYRYLSGVSNWLGRLRFDIERAEVVIFVGFSAADFHLTQVFFNAAGLRDKAFFINRPSANPDPDERAVQEDFGEPLYIGRDEFAQIVTELLQEKVRPEPKLASFSRYQSPKASSAVPPVKDIEDLLIWGRVIPGHLKRDHDLKKSDYHVLRSQSHNILDNLKGGGKIILVNGDICDGKSLVILGAMNDISGRAPVFELRHAYTDLLDETAAILSIYPNAILVVENCFSLREDRLLGLVRQISASAGNAILSSRSISTEAESSKLKGLRAIPSFLEIGIGRLQAVEIDAFIALIDQIAGWRDFRALSPAQRRRFIETECRGVIPSVLLRLLDSEYVREKYREEYNKSEFIGIKEKLMVISSLLISNIGFDPPLSLISDMFEEDFEGALKKIASHGVGLKLVRIEGGSVRTIPSIGVRNLLKNVVEPREIVNANIYLLEKMAGEVRRTDFEQHLFSQLMRYSILSSTVSDVSEVNRFFDHISKIGAFRDMPLFWLQWHMAMSAQNRWVDAEKYLEMGYTAADSYERRRGEKFNRKQLDDRRAKFLASRAEALMRSGVELFRDVKEALDIVGRLMQDTELTHHPYETLLEIAKVLRSRGNTIMEVQSAIILRQMKGVVEHARRKLSFVPEGYQRSHASEWLNQVEADLA